MKTFADLNIDVEQDFFVCAKMSMDDLLNKKVVVLGAKKGIKTRIGDNRYLLHVQLADGTEVKTFTTARFIKAAIDQLNDDDYPFETTIKSIKTDNKKMYKFT
jgi:hypothetical protein